MKKIMQAASVTLHTQDMSVRSNPWGPSKLLIFCAIPGVLNNEVHLLVRALDGFIYKARIKILNCDPSSYEYSSKFSLVMFLVRASCSIIFSTTRK